LGRTREGLGTGRNQTFVKRQNVDLGLLRRSESVSAGALAFSDLCADASRRVPNMQIEKMKVARDIGLKLSFVASEGRVENAERRLTQTPGVFYRRESEALPLIVAKR
jgi:hypothetical protein